MAPEKRDSSEYFLEDSDYDVEDIGWEAAEDDDDDDQQDAIGLVSRSSSVVSQQWPRSFRYLR